MEPTFTNVIRTCPQKQGIDWPVYWYHLTSTPDFLICSNCYSTYIACTTFAQSFTGKQEPGGTSRQCLFNTPRITQRLWPAAVRAGDLQPIEHFMLQRSKIPCCPGKEGVDATKTPNWYSPEGVEPRDFGVCEACYEDIILATQFAGEFQCHPGAQPATAIWACELAWGAVRRATQAAPTGSTWLSTVEAAHKGTQLPGCTGGNTSLSKKSAWYRPKEHIPNLVICDSCYYEFIMHSPFDSEFEYSAPQGQSGWTCDFALLSIRAPWEAALQRNNYRIWWDTANTVIKLPVCLAEGIENGTWYSLAPPLSDLNFDVCAACYAGVLRSFGCADHFRPRPFVAGGKRFCDLNPATQRGTAYLSKLTEAVGSLSFSIFCDFVRSVHSLPYCPRDTPTADRFWYGFLEAYSCEECYEVAVKGTALAGQLQLYKQQDTGEATCDMYSARMRAKWATACKTNDLAGFLTFARQRAEVYTQTMPEVRSIRRMRNLRLQESLHYQQLAVTASAGDFLRDTCSSTTQRWEVRTSNGYYGHGSSHWSAQMEATAESKRADVFRAGEVEREAILEARWKAVE